MEWSYALKVCVLVLAVLVYAGGAFLVCAVAFSYLESFESLCSDTKKIKEKLLGDEKESE